MIVLLDEQDGDSPLLDILQHFFERLDDDGRKPLAGFIEDHQVGSGHESAPDCQHLLLAPGKLSAETLPPLGEPGENLKHMFNGLARWAMLRRAISDREMFFHC